MVIEVADTSSDVVASSERGCCYVGIAFGVSKADGVALDNESCGVKRSNGDLSLISGSVVRSIVADGGGWTVGESSKRRDTVISHGGRGQSAGQKE